MVLDFEGMGLPPGGFMLRACLVGDPHLFIQHADAR